MSIEINLIPEEFKPKPLMKTQTLAVLVLVLVLGFGCYYLFSSKAGDEAEASDMEKQTTSIRSQITTIQNDLAVTVLQSEIAELQADKSKYDGLNGDYTTFTDSRIEWGYVTDKIKIRQPWGVNIASISQDGDSNIVTVQGTANNFDRVSVYVTQLEEDPLFSGVTTLSWEASNGQFSLSFVVESGGGA